VTDILEILVTTGFWAATLRIASPLIFGTLGELICERAGVLNLGIEGIMTIGAMAGWMWVYQGGSGDLWGGILFAALVGGIFGTALIPIPIVGSVLGVCMGAFAGALGVELLTGRELHHSVRSGRGAAVGRFFGILIKLSIGVAIYATIAAAAFVS